MQVGETEVRYLTLGRPLPCSALLPLDTGSSHNVSLRKEGRWPFLLLFLFSE